MIQNIIGSNDSVRQIWRYDIQDLLQGKRTLVAIFLFIMIAEVQSLFGYLMWAPQEALTTTKLIIIISDGFRLTVPVFGVLVGYGAIAGDRETHRLRLYLSMPYVRREFFVGRFLSRLSWTIIPVGVGLLAGVLTCIGLAKFRFLPVLSLILATLVLAALSVSISIAISAVVQSSRSALFISLGLFAFFYTSWWIASVASLFFSGSTIGATIVSLVDPTAAYTQVFAFLEGKSSLFALSIAVVSLITWLIFPLIIGTVRFERNEI